MTNERKKEIEIKAIELLEAVDSMEKFPVDFMDVVKYLGIKIFNAQFSKPLISGAIRKNNNDEYEILVKEDDIETRRRFTIAHEIGHYILHREKFNEDENIHYDIMFRNSIDSEDELEANYFASCLLMPEEPFKKCFELFNSEEEIRGYFNVSKAAFLRRRVELDV